MSLKGNPAAMLASKLKPEDVESELSVLTQRRPLVEGLVRQAATNKNYDYETPIPPTPTPNMQPTSGGLQQPKSEAEYNRLPSGTIYIHPKTGKKMRKK